MYTLGLVLFTGSASAGWVGGGEAGSLYSHNTKYLLHTNISSHYCGADGMFWWPKGSDDARDMYSMALTAISSGKTIYVVEKDDCDANNRSLITHMRIDK